MFPIQITVSYWDIPASRMAAHLERLRGLGVSEITTFIPWQMFESDVSHALGKFLQVAADKKLRVQIVVTPELGVHAQNSGLPKDLFANDENAARAFGGDKALCGLAPNLFSIPSLYAPTFTKRFQGFLSRLQTFFSDLERQNPRSLQGSSILIGGSFWKHYRSAHTAASEPFGGSAWDHSRHASAEFQQRLGEFYSQQEFMEPHPGAANRWKMKAFDELNQKWFHQQSEDVFRNKAAQILSRRSLGSRLSQVEIFTPETDASCFYATWLARVSGGEPDLSIFNRVLDESATRTSCASREPCAPVAHWTSLGLFHELSDPEKQFLILKSLLLMGGRGGSVWIDDREWFSLSPAFQARAMGLAQSVSEGKLKISPKVLYLIPHLWSGAGVLSELLETKIGVDAQTIASIDLLDTFQGASLAIVDPACVITRATLTALIRWAQMGRIVALPSSVAYTEQSRALLEQVVSQGKSLDIGMGIPYFVHELGNGSLVVYETANRVTTNLSVDPEMGSSWDAFIEAMLRLASIRAICGVSDSRVHVIPLERPAGDGQSVGLFVMNSSASKVSANLLFREPVFVSDLKTELEAATMSRLELEVPPRGILPLSIAGLNRDSSDRRTAALLEEVTRGSAEQVARDMLPGFAAEKGSSLGSVI